MTTTIGSIATYIVNTIPTLPAGVSGNMIITVDYSRMYVADYTGQTIGSNAIEEKFQPAIVCFAQADAIEQSNAGAGGDNLKLADLTVDSNGETMSAEGYRKMGTQKLKDLTTGPNSTIGRKTRFARSLS